MPRNDPPNAEGKGKGKGKETDDTSTPPTTTSTTNDSPSVFSRIAQSAAGLSRDMVSARPSGGDLASLMSAEKGGQASRGQPGAAATAGEGSSAALPSWSAPQSSGSHAQQHVMEQDEAFSQFLDGTSIDMSMPTEPIIGLDDAGMEAAWKQQTTWTQDRQSGEVHTSTTTQFITQPSSAVAEQERIDGLDVVNLLAVDGPPEEEPDYGDIELAEDEITALRLALFGDRNSEEKYSAATATTTNLDWDTALNFIPDFVRPNPGGGYEEGLGGVVKSGKTQAALGLAHTPESTRQWLDQWHSVLTRYDDEVWGGLSPLVARAREEVDQLQQSEELPQQQPPDQSPASTKALNRLRQILGHLRE
ncbi:hypothetical protein Sste5346_001922 [Sporothrix stenoceras]|uniref:Uncharacterized protein n=1 Tax=Sporothrix stenoceras TaxID=5173 RepID=A0ABR3ZN72_9PEZI